MDIFNKIGSKLTEAGKGVSDQTKTLTEITKLNMTISSNEKAINDMYTELGKAYYAKVKDGGAEVGEEFVNKMNALAIENDKLREDVKKLKGEDAAPQA